ncbi:MAG: HXXEE domain-containing protein [Bacteroidota bacterium]|nr:HXXEE domain-containing protein [Bacteroidota bacterium]
MKLNKYQKLWFAVFGMHTLHQLEESISFFDWYVQYANKMGAWAILGVDKAQLAIAHPEYFVLASFAQLFTTSMLAFLFRNNLQATKWLVFIYIVGLNFFLIWHVASCYVVHSYAPIMVTCLMGMFLTPGWLYRLFSTDEKITN